MIERSDESRRGRELPRRTEADLERLRRIASAGDEELTAAAQRDPDNPPLTDEELAELQPTAPQAFMQAQAVLKQLESADDATVLDVVAGAAAMLADRRRRAARKTG